MNYMRNIIFLIFTIPCFLFSQESRKIDSLLSLIEKTKVDSIKSKKYAELLNEVKFQHPDSTRHLFEKAHSLTFKNGFKEILANLHNNRAIPFGVYGINDSCIKHLNTSVQYFKELTPVPNDIGFAYNNLGSAYGQLGYYTLSYKNQLKALKAAELAKDSFLIAFRTQGLAITYYKLNEPEISLYYALQAYDFFKNQPDNYLKINNIIRTSGVYELINNYDSALVFIQKAEDLIKKYKNGVDLSLLFSTKGEVLRKKNQYHAAVESFNKALFYCDSLGLENDKFVPYWGLINIFMSQNDNSQANFYLSKVLKLANTRNEFDHKTGSYKLAYQYYKKTGKPSEALKYLELFKQWSDSVINEKKQKQIIESNIIYNTDKNEQLLKYQQKENQLQRIELDIKEKTLWLISILSIIFILSILLFYIQRQKAIKSKHKNQLLEMQVEIQDGIKQELASSLHTGMGSELSAIILGLENKNENNRLTKEIEQIKNHYNSIRNKSSLLKIPSFIQTTIEEEIQDIVSSYKTNDLNINCSIYSEQSWLDIHPIIQQNIFRISQELLLNTVKHAQAKEIELQITRHQSEINLMYEDNGVGYNPQEIRKQLGYKNEIIARVASIKGTFTDDSIINQGANLQFKFPVIYEKKN